MKMTTFWENERRKLLGQPLIADDDTQANTAIDAPQAAVLSQAEDYILVTPTIGILIGFYIGATNDTNYTIAKREILELIPPQDRLRINLVFEERDELPHLCKVRLVNLGSSIPGQIIAGQDYIPNSDDDNGIWLIYHLCISNNGYLYQLATYAPRLKWFADIPSGSTANDIQQKITFGTRLDQINLEDSNFGENGAANYSTTKRNIQEKGEILLPNSDTFKPLASEEAELFVSKANLNQVFGVKSTTVKILSVTTLFDAVTTLHPTALWSEKDQNNNIVSKPRGASVFHELWEIWERTDNFFPYALPEFDKYGIAIGKGIKQKEDEAEEAKTQGAHYRAITAEARFWNRSLMPGGFWSIRF